MKALIIADDLSGAADCAAAARLEATVVFAAGIMPDSEIVAVDINSRNLAPEIAAQRAGEAFDQMATDNAELVYCKMDSTLRGNWAAEIAAVRARMSRRHGRVPLTIVSPGLPEKGRTIRGGRAYVDAMPLEHTSFWNAGKEGADLVTICRRQGLLAVSIDSGLGPALLLRKLAAAEAGSVLVVDMESRRDADSLASAGLSVEAPVLWAGSAGLIDSLAARLGWRSAPRPFDPVGGPVLIVVGSASPLSHRQSERLRREPAVFAETISPDELLRSARSLAAQRAALESALISGRDVVLRIGVDAVSDDRLAAAFAEFVAPLAKRAGGLVLTGGETAREVLSRLGVTALRLRGEVEPIVPLAITSGSVVIPVVTKAGAFGTEDTLFNCREVLHGRRNLLPDRGLPQ